MIKYLKVKNFLSFKDEAEVNFESDMYGKSLKNNSFYINKKINESLIKSTLIYGANASGKSNLLKALWIIQKTVLKKGKLPQVKSFLFNDRMRDEPSFFEIGFFIGQQEYSYSFLRTTDVVFEEILKEGEKILFKRSKQEILEQDDVFAKEISKGLDKMKPEYSLLSVLHEWDGQLCGKPIGSFFEGINIILDGDFGVGETIEQFNLFDDDNHKKSIVIKFLQLADISIDDVKVTEESFPKEFLDKVSQERRRELEEAKHIRIELGRKSGKNNEMRRISLGSESQGTQKLFEMLGPIIDTIINEKILIVDEVETNLHILILYKLFDLIHADLGKKYQFIFTTHNTELLNLNMFRKHQIGFVNKKSDFSTEFYTLDEYDVRGENDVKKMYKSGLFGAIPYVQDFTSLIDLIQGVEDK